MEMHEFNLVQLDDIKETIKAVRDRQRKEYDTLPAKKTVARHIASTHVEFCDQLLQAIGKMRKITLAFHQEESRSDDHETIIQRIREAFGPEA